MAKNFKLNLSGLNELMKSQGMQAHLRKAAEVVAKSAGADYDRKGYVINFVAVENVFPASKQAAHENYENNTLVKALGAAGLPMTK